MFLRLPDQGLEDTHEFRKEIVRLIRLYKPQDRGERPILTGAISGIGTMDCRPGDASMPSFPMPGITFLTLICWKRGYIPIRSRRFCSGAADEVNCRFDITETFPCEGGCAAVSQESGWTYPARGAGKQAEGKGHAHWPKERISALAEGFHRVEILW